MPNDARQPPAPRREAAGRAQAPAGHEGAQRTLMVCADDFGLGAGVGEGVAELVEAGRLNAVSCLVTAPGWRAQAARLATLRGRAQVGLHFNLTEGRPLSAALARHWAEMPGLSRCLRLAMLRALPLDAIGQEFDAQWRAFVEASGALPQFVDGHQHVHHLPGVRGVVLGRLQALAPGLPLRSTAHVAGPASWLKRRVIEASGGRALESELRARGWPHSGVLLGAYDFREPDYGRLVRAWLQRAPASGALLFCHPARPGARAPGDAIAPAREREFAYFAGPAFERDLAEAGVVLGTAWG